MVYIILGEGFEETEAIVPGDLLRRGKVETAYAGIGGKRVKGSHGIVIEADCTVEEINLEKLDMIVLPGGLRGVETIRSCPAVLNCLRFAFEHDRFVAAICAAPTVLAELHITDGRKAVCYPGMENQMPGACVTLDVPAVRDGKVITGTSAGCSIPFAKLLLEAMAGKETADAVIKSIAIRS